MQNPAKVALRQHIAKVLKGISAENQQSQSDKITQKVKRFIIYVLATSSGAIISWNRLSYATHSRNLFYDSILSLLLSRGIGDRKKIKTWL